MLELLREFFSSEFFMPHGHCYLWQPSLLWLQATTNGLIGLAYVGIAATLAYLVKRGDYIPFKGMALAFGVFIITCGFTHFLDVYVIWQPVYWVDGGVRAVTAAASVATALLLPRLVPEALALARGAKAARERGVELQAVVEDLAHMYQKAKELDELKTQFFANVSHELRTPLALIMGPAEKLQAAGNLSAAQRRDLDLILRNAQTLLKHVNDLLDVSRLEAGRTNLRYTDTDLARLVSVVAGHFAGIADERGIAFAIDTPTELRAQIDADKLQRVVLNLLSNAFKFTPPGGRIRITVSASGEGAVKPRWSKWRTADRGSGPNSARWCSSASARSKAGPRAASGAPAWA